MFKRFKNLGKEVIDATVEAGKDLADLAEHTYDGAKAAFKGAKVITEGVKEVHLTREQLEALINEDATEIMLDDTATDDGYDQVRVTKVLPAM